MAWNLDGRLRSVAAHLSVDGKRSLGGGGLSRFSYAYIGDANEGIETLGGLIQGSESEPDDMGGYETVKHVRTTWGMWSGSHPEVENLVQLYQATQAEPMSTAISCTVIPDAPEYHFQACVHVCLVLRDAHFDLVYQHFLSLMGHPSARFSFNLGITTVDFRNEANSLGASTSRDFLSGVPLILSPAELEISFRPSCDSSRRTTPATPK